jgi:hypothetical protein
MHALDVLGNSVRRATEVAKGKRERRVRGQSL